MDKYEPIRKRLEEEGHSEQIIHAVLDLTFNAERRAQFKMDAFDGDPLLGDEGNPYFDFIDRELGQLRIPGPGGPRQRDQE